MRVCISNQIDFLNQTFETDIILGTAYIPPQQSRFHFDDAKRGCIYLKWKWMFYLLEDANAHFSVQAELITVDDFLLKLFQFDKEIIESYFNRSYQMF
jgi:hypothetical protein